MKTIFKCPICTGQMESFAGDNSNAEGTKNGGMTVICLNKDCNSSENVFGHGRNEKDAFETAGEKFRLTKIK